VNWVVSVTASRTAAGRLDNVNMPKSRPQDRAVAVVQCLALAVLALAGLGLVLLTIAGPALAIGIALALANRGWHFPLAFGVAVIGIALWACLAPAAMTAIRPLANVTRSLSARWCGVPIAMPYQEESAGPGIWRPVARLRADPAARRDLVWLAVGGCLGGVLLLVPAVLVVVGLVVFIGSRVLPEIPQPAYPGNSTESILIAGTLLTAAGLYATPWLLRAHGALASLLLGPVGSAELEQRVQHLSRTRDETIDASAAEIRRIERDLHDGAQARLVAMGMTLDAAGHLIDEDPKTARALLVEARDNSAKALRELRELVRGIHPPVLADRGLAEAVRALALDTPLCIHLSSDLDQAARPSAPIESAAYFAVTELVANVAKHAQASQAWIDIRHGANVLKISVADDGQGGADLARGSGLRGIERRLAAFDGVLAVASPPGGPTTVTLEIPCAPA
jgi:signal transduction histidine kinase